jgi:hypothetical protein
MIQSIDLNKYLLMGGKIEKLQLERVRCTWTGHERKKILSITKAGKNTEGIQLYTVNFHHAVFHCSGTWIETDVLLSLNNRYI